MPDIAWSPRPGPNRYDIGWGVLAAASVAAMVAWPSWEALPFYVIWISLTLLYGFRVWSMRATILVLIVVFLSTGTTILWDAFDGMQRWDELCDVPLVSLMFLVMVWHARRRAQAIRTAQRLADERAASLEQEERLIQNVSHELRTPVTIARGHLELLQRQVGPGPELAVAFDELACIEQIVERLLLLARAERRDFIFFEQVPLLSFLEDTFMRWVEVAPRAWRLGDVVDVDVTADEAWLRAALDALLENAVQFTDPHARIELSARAEGDSIVIAVEDEGIGIAPDVATHVFERFARSDESRARREGGSGLGLAIVAAIARTHGGAVTVRQLTPGPGSIFEVRLPLVEACNADREEAPEELATLAV